MEKGRNERSRQVLAHVPVAGSWHRPSESKVHASLPVFSGRGLFFDGIRTEPTLPVLESFVCFHELFCLIMQAAEVVSSTTHSFMTHLSSSYLRSRQCAECWSCHGNQDRTFSCFHSLWLWNESYKKRHLQYNLIKIQRPYLGS